MECNEYQELISAYVDGMLSPQEEKRLKQHLEVCKQCKSHYEAMVQMTKACEQIKEVELPNGFHERLMERLKDEEKLTRHTVLKWHRKWQYTGALVATLLVGGLFINQLSSFKQNSSLQNRSTGDEELERSSSTMEGESLLEASVYSAEMSNDIEDHSVQIVAQNEMELEVQVEDIGQFEIEFESFLSQQQITYEKIECGYRITEVAHRKQLTTWIENHSQWTWWQPDEEEALQSDVFVVTIRKKP